MYFPEYLSTAQRHLVSCRHFLEGVSADWESMSEIVREHTLRDLYYLSGYIMEAFTVFLAYKIGGFEMSKDIKIFDYDFTKLTGIDFYANRYGKSPSSKINDLDYKDKELRGSDGLLFVNKHGFKELKERIFNYNPEQSNVISNGTKQLWTGVQLPPGLKLTYFQDSIGNKSVEKLIESWRVELRYQTIENAKRWNMLKKHLNFANICSMISVCEEINKDIETWVKKT